MTIGAEIDIEDVRSYRNYMKSRCVMASRKKSFPRVTVDFSLGADEEGAPVMLERADWELLTAEQEIRYGKCRPLSSILFLGFIRATASEC